LIKTFDAERLKEIVTFLNHSRAHRGLCEALLYVYDEEPLSFRHHPLDVDIEAFSVSEVLKRFQEQQDLIIWSLEFGDLLLSGTRSGRNSAEGLRNARYYRRLKLH
jgi:hypothetical protein